ncbi:hypothetical protein F528_0466 [Neisseria meningitidis 992008]|nr:hypothetical protein F528_0470 [Neisseria meningitidis 992008]KER40584.1 hypothetical protein F528_0466 [Neisseria meningitidis 992008]
MFSDGMVFPLLKKIDIARWGKTSFYSGLTLNQYGVASP